MEGIENCNQDKNRVFLLYLETISSWRIAQNLAALHAQINQCGPLEFSPHPKSIDCWVGVLVSECEPLGGVLPSSSPSVPKAMIGGSASYQG